MRFIRPDFRITMLLVCTCVALPGSVADRADAIVVGEVTGQQIAQPGSLTLRVDRTLKGDLISGSFLRVDHDFVTNNRVPRRDFVGDFGIWFLRAKSGGSWQLVLPERSNGAELPGTLYWSPLPKGINPAISSVPTASPEDLIALELASAIEQTQGSRGMSYYFANNFLVLPQSPAVVAQYRRLSQSTNPQAQVVGLIGLIRQGDVASLLQLLTPSDAVRNTNLGAQLFSAVRNVRAGSATAVEALGKLATLPSALQKLPGLGPAFPVAAADALRAIHTPDSLPYLAAMLESSNAEIRSHGMAGLSMFVENLPIQTPEMIPGFSWMKPQGSAPYRTADTDKYSAKLKVPPERHAEFIGFWKSWWATKQVELSAK